MDKRGAFTAPLGLSERPLFDVQLSKKVFSATSQKSEMTKMLPYWIDLSLGDLMQATGFVAMAITMLTFQFLLPSR